MMLNTKACAFIFSWLAFLLLTQRASAQLQFGVDKHEFGEVKEENGLVEHVFKFQNTSKSYIQLEVVKTSCGCTTPEWSKDSIAPGGEGFVKVRFDPMGRPGPFRKEVYVQQKGRSAPYTLNIGGKVTPRPKGPKDYYPFEEGSLRFKTNHLTYGSIFKDESQPQTTIIYNQGSKPIKFIPSKSKIPSHLKPSLSKLELAPGDTASLTITYNAAAKDDYGFAFDNVFLATTDASQPIKKINISADVRERFPSSGPEAAHPPRIKLDNVTHDLGRIEEGEMPEAVFRVSNMGGSTLKIRKLSAGCTCVVPAITQTSLEPGEQALIRARFNTRGRIGEQEKEIVLICNDPSDHELVLRINATIFRPAAQPETER
jgi:hypothetical protein